MSESRLRPAVVLVADRTLSARYRVLFEGIFATMQTRQVPGPMMRHFLAPPVGTDRFGRARTAPLGLRRVEASLICDAGLAEDDVVCTTPEAIGSLLGPWTKIVGFSSADPLGKGMSNTTTSNFWKGELYTRYWSRMLLEQIGAAKKKFGFKVIGGGAGAWQWLQYKDSTACDTLDTVFDGYFEEAGPSLIKEMLSGRWAGGDVCSRGTFAEKIRPIRGASLMGVVELSRGCGRGCGFCTMAEKKMEHLDAEVILSDLRTNVAGGVRSAVSGSEDFFRYGATGIKPDFEKLCSLLEQMRRISGLSFMQIDHANISSVAQLSDQQLGQIRRLLTWEKPTEFLWVNMGAESASGALVSANCPGKTAPFRADDWEDLLYATAQRMTKNGYFAVFSIVMGLPGETGRDVARTLKFVRFLENQRAAVFPVFYEPFRAEQIQAGEGFSLKKFRPDHLELLRNCYEINFRQIPRLFWDNQRAGGVGWLKRAAMQTLGKAEVFSWRRTFVRIGRRLKEESLSERNYVPETVG